MTHRRQSQSALLLLALTLLGCDAAEQAKAQADAAMTQAEAAEQRAAEAEKQVGELDTRIAAAEKQIADATKQAEDAMKRADEAMKRVDEAAVAASTTVIDTVVGAEEVTAEAVCAHLLTIVGKELGNALETEELAKSREECVKSIEKEKAADPAKFDRTARCALKATTVEEMVQCDKQ